ncbi:MAG TPA: AMIN domain-containing protein [Gemmatimonadaceae bacterium]|nr:AMIN domain-containing protein [Gemmatimonadaceae bacterium]
MKPHRTLASAMLAAFGAVGGRPAVAPALPTTPNDATVIALSVVPTTGRADVVIRLDGSVSIKHFVLSKPDKIVVDMSGATLALPQGDAYDGVARGGITRIRYSQFTKTVVRVVLTLDAPHAYDVTQSNGEIHITVDGANDKFTPWRLTSESADALPAAPVHVKPAAPAVTQPAAPAVTQLVSAPVSQPAAPEPIEQPAQHYGATAAEIKRFGSQQSQEPRITWSGENTPINDVLAIFSAFTGRTILPSKGVTGTITASINNLPWDVALKEIMNANGYDVTVNPDGVIVIDTFENVLARQATTPLETRTIRLNYARANAAAPMILPRLTRSCPITAASAMAASVGQPVGAPGAAPAPGAGVQSITCPARGTVTADTITNSVSITDVPSALPDLIQYARSLDLRQPQVNIKAKIILVDRTTLEGLGLRYDLGSQQQFFNDIIPRVDSTGRARTDAGQILLGGNTISAIANATQRIPSAALQLVYSTAMGNFDFTTFLEALQQNTLLDVQAEPSGTILNNRTVNLTAGTQVPIRVIDAGATSGGAQTTNFPRATVQMQQTGVILEVTPQITANRQIQMKVHVENSDVQFQSNDVGAVFPKQSVDNVVLVADGETAVMGGLTQTTVSVSKSGLPVLVDLPIIGRLFGVTTRQETKRDLLILITPHIIDDGQSLPDSGRP